MALRRTAGTIRYTSDQPERRGAERGREEFLIVERADGGRTLQAHSQIDDAPAVCRFVTVSLAPDGRPLDASVRLDVGGVFRGSSWYRFGAGEAECDGFTVLEGRFSQRFRIDSPVRAFGAHPLQNDAWVVRSVDRAAGPGWRSLPVMMSSTDHRGATGPTLVPITTEVEYVGEERVRVAAGEFAAFHFRFGSDAGWNDDDPLRHPEYHLWCSADEDFLFLKGHVSGYMQTRYELVRLERN